MNNRYYIILLSITFLFTTSCKKKNEIKVTEIGFIVTDMEILVNNFDKSVDNALAEKNVKDISILSKNVKDSINSKINSIKSIQNSTLIKPTTEYLESLISLVDIESRYSNLTDSSSMEFAKNLDDSLSLAIKNVEQSRAKYTTAFKKLER